MSGENDYQREEELARWFLPRMCALLGWAIPVMLVFFAMTTPRWGAWNSPPGMAQVILAVVGPFVILGTLGVVAIRKGLKRRSLHSRISIVWFLFCSWISLACLWQLAVHLDVLPGNELHFVRSPLLWLAVTVAFAALIYVMFRTSNHNDSSEPDD